MEKSLCYLLLLMLTLSWISPMGAASVKGSRSLGERSKRQVDDDDDDDDDSNERRKNLERYIDQWKDVDDESVCRLRAYDADKELDKIRDWHDLIKTPIDEATAVRQLLIESCEDEAKAVMCRTFVMVRQEKKCLPGLTKAECLAVTMYSAEFGGFYREYNNASSYGVWEPYRVYTSLLYSAVRKLAAIEPVPVDAKLYRGMSLRCRAPDAKRIFWKTFTSTTLDEEIAGYFGEETSLVFEGRATLIGARIRNLSLIEMEDEVLIPPFEVFDFLRADQQTFYFSSSKSQELLHDGGCTAQLSLFVIMTTVTLPIVFVTSLF